MQKSTTNVLGRKQQKRGILLSLVSILLLPGSLWSSSANQWDSLKIISFSTGETTGHIADLYISHSSPEVKEFHLTPSFIPSQEEYQSYLTLTDTILVLEPFIETRIELRGYCADIFVDPVPLKKNLPEFSNWIQIDVNSDKSQFNPDRRKWVKDPHSRILNPNNLLPLSLAIDSEEHPEESAWLLWYTLIKLEAEYNKLSSENLISTPYSQDKAQERNGVVQHSFWIVTSELNGKYYLKELFEEGIRKQYNELNNLSSNENDQILKGIRQLWIAFHLLLHESMIMDIYKINTRFVKVLDEEILLLKEGKSID